MTERIAKLGPPGWSSSAFVASEEWRASEADPPEPTSGATGSPGFVQDDFGVGTGNRGHHRIRTGVPTDVGLQSELGPSDADEDWLVRLGELSDWLHGVLGHREAAGAEGAATGAGAGHGDVSAERRRAAERARRRAVREEPSGSLMDMFSGLGLSCKEQRQRYRICGPGFPGFPVPQQALPRG
uniref:Uncharacterized protein n=1 Tax=Alexandrium catenella TaxID=2925 RepID=A0A7S1RK66_ALECA